MRRSLSVLALLLAAAVVSGEQRVVITGTGTAASGTCDEANVLSDGASACPRLTGANIFGNYIGAWKGPPTSDPLCTFENLGSGTLGDIHMTSATSMWMVDGFTVSEVDLPALSTSANPTLLNPGTWAQNCIDIIGDSDDGLFYDDVDGQDHSGAKLSGVIEYGGHLYISGYPYFSGPGAWPLKGLFKVTPPLMSAVIGDTVVGWDGDGVVTASTGAFTGHYADEIPTEWQTALGGPAFFGGDSGIPIITRTSNCPTFIVIDPTQIGTTTVTGQGLLYCLDLSATASWGQYDTNIAPDRWGSTASIGGCVIINGTRTWVCVGARGTGATYGACYGAPDIINGNGCNGVIPPGGDPESGNEGYHAPPYEHMYWLVDLNDLKAVKDGTGGKLPTNVVPYEYGVLTLPYSSSHHRAGGMDYDPVNKKLHFLQLRVWGGAESNGWPVGLVYQVDDTP